MSSCSPELSCHMWVYMGEPGWWQVTSFQLTRLHTGRPVRGCAASLSNAHGSFFLSFIMGFMCCKICLLSLFMQHFERGLGELFLDLHCYVRGDCTVWCTRFNVIVFETLESSVTAISMLPSPFVLSHYCSDSCGLDVWYCLQMELFTSLTSDVWCCLVWHAPKLLVWVCVQD